MASFNWKGIDLNLLIALQALYKTNSVSKAAERCFVSQSAMSHSLQRLRKLFDDPLFERVGSRMEPTERAIELSHSVDLLLAQIQTDILRAKPFNPQTYDGVWKIGLTDYAEQMFGPSLFDTIKRLAPQSKVALFNVNRANYQQVYESEKLDVVIGSFGEAVKRYSTQLLYTEQHVCLYDGDVCKFSDPISLLEFTSVEHALVSPNGAMSTGVDKKLEERGLKRQVSFISSNFLTVKNLIQGRELICIVPKLVATQQNTVNSIKAAMPPIDVPDFDIQLMYRKGMLKDNKNKFIRNLVSETVIRVAKKGQDTNQSF